MFTFVIWAIGLCIVGYMASFNLGVIVAAFEHNWLVGLLTVLLSIGGWGVLLLIFI